MATNKTTKSKAGAKTAAQNALRLHGGIGHKH